MIGMPIGCMRPLNTTGNAVSQIKRHRPTCRDMVGGMGEWKKRWLSARSKLRSRRSSSSLWWMCDCRRPRRVLPHCLRFVQLQSCRLIVVARVCCEGGYSYSCSYQISDNKSGTIKSHTHPRSFCSMYYCTTSIYYYVCKHRSFVCTRPSTRGRFRGPRGARENIVFSLRFLRVPRFPCRTLEPAPAPIQSQSTPEEQEPRWR